jgi:hypothetical protein
MMRLMNDNAVYAWPSDFVILDRAAAMVNKWDADGDGKIGVSELAAAIDYKGV